MTYVRSSPEFLIKVGLSVGEKIYTHVKVFGEKIRTDHLVSVIATTLAFLIPIWH